MAEMAKTQTRPWDPAEHLETEEDMAAYLLTATRSLPPCSRWYAPWDSGFGPPSGSDRPANEGRLT